MDERVILVDENDLELGEAGKLEVHREGKLHRAFSIFIFDTHDRLLLQRRAAKKYHSGGLWTNTCCSHPRPGEDLLDAASRRLREEMGIDCPLEKVFSFVYRAELDNALIEHEFDHVLVGRYDGHPQPNPEEADAWTTVELDWLGRDIRIHPHRYTYWLSACIDEVVGLLTADYAGQHAIAASACQ